MVYVGNVVTDNRRERRQLQDLLRVFPDLGNLAEGFDGLEGFPLTIQDDMSGVATPVNAARDIPRLHAEQGGSPFFDQIDQFLFVLRLYRKYGDQDRKLVAGVYLDGLVGG